MVLNPETKQFIETILMSSEYHLKVLENTKGLLQVIEVQFLGSTDTNYKLVIP